LSHNDFQVVYSDEAEAIDQEGCHYLLKDNTIEADDEEQDVHQNYQCRYGVVVGYAAEKIDEVGCMGANSWDGDGDGNSEDHDMSFDE